jgi:hypothetical protein
VNLSQERVGDRHKVELREFYKDYDPPRRVFRTVRKLLDRVPEQYLQGLDCVVLTNMSGQPRHVRLGKIPSNKGRVSRSKVLGLYHGAHRGKLPWIEIYVDNIAAPHKGHLWVPFMREFVFGEVLLHEIGHHIHATVAREHSDKEDVAERWKKELWGLLRLKRNRFTRIAARLFVLPPIKLFLQLRRVLRRQGTVRS